MVDIFDEFAEALRTKFRITLQKHPDRSTTPWQAYDRAFLLDRLLDEIDEYRQTLLQLLGLEAEAGEAIDIGEFALFLWAKAKCKGGLK